MAVYEHPHIESSYGRKWLKRAPWSLQTHCRIEERVKLNKKEIAQAVKLWQQWAKQGRERAKKRRKEREQRNHVPSKWS